MEIKYFEPARQHGKYPRICWMLMQ